MSDDVDELYAQSVAHFQKVVRHTKESWVDLRGVYAARREVTKGAIDDPTAIRDVFRPHLAKAWGHALGQTLSVPFCAILFSIGALMHYLGAGKTLVMFGAMVGTSTWVAFTDRTSLEAFAIANFLGVVVLLFFALLIALKDYSDDS